MRAAFPSIPFPLLLITLAACGGGGSSAPPPAATPIAAGTIGPAGGVLEVTDPGRPLRGSKLEVPGGALLDEVELRMFATGETRPPADVAALGAVMLRIEPDGTGFAQNATLTLPYPDADMDGIVDSFGIPEEQLIAISSSGSPPIWTRNREVQVDLQSDLLSFEIAHLSAFGLAADQVLRPGRIGIHFMSGSRAITADEETAIFEAISNGAWRPLLDCAGFTMETSSLEDAEILVYWQTAREIRTMSPNAPADVHAVTFGPQTANGFKYEIVLREDLVSPFVWHTGPGPVPSQAFDLRSVVLHEFAHVLGLYSEQCGCMQTTTDDIIHGQLQNGIQRDVLSQNDIDAFFHFQQVVFSGFQPNGATAEALPTFEVVIDPVCGGTQGQAVDASTVELLLERPDGTITALTPALESRGSQVIARAVPPAPLQPGEYRVHVVAGSVRAQWTATSKGYRNFESFDVEVVNGVWREDWQSTAAGSYEPNRMIRGDAATWLVLDTITDNDCGVVSPHRANVLGGGGIELVSVQSGSSCADNIWIETLGRQSIPLRPTTRFGFVSSGDLDSPWNTFPGCFLPPCGDNAHIALVDNRGNVLVYVLLAAPRLPETSSPKYRQIVLVPDPSSPSPRSFSRNVFEDFSTIPSFDPNNAFIDVIVFSLDEHGQARLGSLAFFDG